MTSGWVGGCCMRRRNAGQVLQLQLPAAAAHAPRPASTHRPTPACLAVPLTPQNQEFFAEEEQDERYETESEPEDRFDADFNESVRGCCA